MKRLLEEIPEGLENVSTLRPTALKKAKRGIDLATSEFANECGETSIDVSVSGLEIVVDESVSTLNHRHINNRPDC